MLLTLIFCQMVLNVLRLYIYTDELFYHDVVQGILHIRFVNITYPYIL